MLHTCPVSGGGVIQPTGTKYFLLDPDLRELQSRNLSPKLVNQLALKKTPKKSQVDIITELELCKNVIVSEVGINAKPLRELLAFW